MVAAYAGVQIGNIQLVSVSQTNSSRLRLKLPITAAMKILEGFQHRDPLLNAFLDDFVLLKVEAVSVSPNTGFRANTDTSEKGLETLIMRHMTGLDGYQMPEMNGAML
jgi:hypothetical protein